MAERMDDTKAIKRKFDDETVEQLVENRFVSDKKASHKPKRKAKKKKNYALSALITILAFVLVFVVFFIGSYIVFTASPQKIEDEIKVTDSKDDKKNEELEKGYEKEELPAPEKEDKEKEDKSDDGVLMKEDDLDVKPSSEKKDKAEDKKPSSTDDDEDEKEKPSSSAAKDENNRSIVIANVNEYEVKAQLNLQGGTVKEVLVCRIDEKNHYTQSREKLQDGILILPANSCVEIQAFDME